MDDLLRRLQEAERRADEERRGREEERRGREEERRGREEERRGRELAEQARREAEHRVEEERRLRELAERVQQVTEGHLQHALVALSTSITPKDKGRLLMQENSVVAPTFDELFDGCGLTVDAGSVDARSWGFRVNARRVAENDLQLRLDKMFNEGHISSSSMTYISCASTPMLFCEDKPDFVFVSTALVSATNIGSLGASKCSWPMANFVGELKSQVFGKNETGYVDAGYEALGQLANRCARYHQDETFYGMLMDVNYLQFWRAAGLPRTWTRWPENGCPIFDSTAGVRGIDYLAAVFRGRPELLRPGGQIPRLTQTLEEIRTVLQVQAAQAVVPMCGVRDDHGMVVQVSGAKVAKLWKGMNCSYNRELSAMKAIGRHHKPIARIASHPKWAGLWMDFLGEVTLHDFARYLLRHSSSENVQMWSHMCATLKLVAVELLDMHRDELVHCDVKPRNIMIRLVNGVVLPKLIDFEHVVQIGETIVGYTTRYCAKYVDAHARGGGVVARRWQDWEALFYSLLSLIVHEESTHRFDAIANPPQYWEQVSAAPRSTNDPAHSHQRDGQRLLVGMKHLTTDENTTAIQFMTSFAAQFEALLPPFNTHAVPTLEEDDGLEERMRIFWTRPNFEGPAQ